MNHHNEYSGNLTKPSESSFYSSESCSVVTRYSKITELLQNKTTRDVATRSRWIYNKKIANRRKEDHNGLGTARVDNEEIVNMVLAAQVYQPSHVFQPSQHGKY
ncbi:hypothetical protein AtEden1_Chr5g0112351 [Arabidopsis thaliana]